MTEVSLVIPCFNEDESLPLFYDAVKKATNKISAEFEYWFVDDGSTDQTLKVIKQFQQANPQVHYISFSRNFGKEAAMYAGLQATGGDYVVVMDADLQDPPQLLPEMFELLKNGEFDCVATQRVDRHGETKIKSFFSNLFYRVLNFISKTKLQPGVRDYRMMTRQMVNAVISLSEYNRFSKGLFSWVGFKTKYLTFHNVKRVAGESHWSIIQLYKYAMDGIVDFSETPLSIATWLGFVSALFSFVGLIVVILRHFINPNASAFGWSSLVCIVLLLSGIQLWFTGILGKYIGRIYLQSKHRPLYIVKEKK